MHPAVAANRPLVFAHRGGAGLAPENTIPAFDRGLALGADGLELDVHLARDGVVMVHHDATLDRTTDTSGPIAARHAAELARVNACAGFTRDGRAWDGPVVGVPTLREVLARYPDTRLVIDLKGSSRELARAVTDEVRRAAAVDRVCVGSFSWQALREARRLEPRMATGASQPEVRTALYASWLRLGIRPRRYAAFQVPERSGATRVVSPGFVRRAHRAGLVVQVWTVDTHEDVHRLLGWGVDAIITDRPDITVPSVEEWQRARRAHEI
jgi:glycerophosphoryl diester phosphodiesterase